MSEKSSKKSDGRILNQYFLQKVPNFFILHRKNDVFWFSVGLQKGDF